MRGEQSAVRVSAEVQQFHRVSMFEVQVDVKPGEDAAAVSRRLDGLIAEFVGNGPTDDEVRRTVMRTLSGRIQGLERVGGFNGKASALAEGMLYANNPDFNRQELHKLAAHRDVATRNAIAYWDTGPPSYRWSEIAVAELLRHNEYTNMAARHLALLHVALHDALVAAWDTKYAYLRARPSEIDRRLVPVVAVPRSPSYPAEHAVAAGRGVPLSCVPHIPTAPPSYTERAEERHAPACWRAQLRSDVRVGLASAAWWRPG